jgi:hypothetical protein
MSSFDHSTSPGRGWCPLVARTSGSVTEGVCRLILATSVIVISRVYDPLDAGAGRAGPTGHGGRLLAGARLRDVLGIGVSRSDH